MRPRGSCHEVAPGVFRLRWSVANADGTRSQPSATFRGSKKDAQRELARRLAEAEHGHAPPARLTLGEHLDDWLETAKPSLAPTSIRSYEYQIGYLKAGLGSVPLARLTARQVQAHYAAEAARGLEPGSVMHQHRILRRALRQARRWKLVPYAVTDDVDAPRLTGSRPAILAPEDLPALLEALAGTPLEAPILLAVATGLREGELLGLWWSDLDWERETLSVKRGVRRTPAGLAYGPPKRQTSRRTLTVPVVALEALRAHERRQEEARRAAPDWQEKGLVFPQDDGDLWHPSTFLGAFKRFLRRAGLPVVTVHSLRHLNVSLQADAGVPPHVIQARAGHASGAQTAHYTHQLDGQDREAARRLDAALRGRSCASRARPGGKEG